MSPDDLAPRDRAELLLSDLHQARDKGEFKRITHCISKLISLPENTLSLPEIREVLKIYKPGKLRDIEHSTIREFLESLLLTLESSSDKAKALTRLGELEMMENNFPLAERYLNDAMKMSMSVEAGTWIPEILESIVEIPHNFKGMRKTAAEIQNVINWVPELEDNDLIVVILATAAVSLAALRMNAAAETAIQAAMTRASVLSPSSRQALEWCRAKVYMASGKKKEAIAKLKRALLLAEKLNDQVAVAKILSTIVIAIKERSGYTIRNLISIMEQVSKNAATSGSVFIHLYALDHLVDMYFRTLLISNVRRAEGEIGRIHQYEQILSDEPVTKWCSAFLGFLTGEIPISEKADILLPGTVNFLQQLERNKEPIKEANVISDFLLSSPGNEAVIYALFLAMESFAEGFEKASVIIATALDSSIGHFQQGPALSWKLCISALLSSKKEHREDFFSSAQILARQMDRLLLVWLIMRCRTRLNLSRKLPEEAKLYLLVAELDRYIAGQLPENERLRFMNVSNMNDRDTILRKLAGGEEGSLTELRDILAGKIESDLDKIIREMSSMSNKISARSEISRSLEILGLLAKVDRILALKVNNGEIRIIESYGFGKERVPDWEAKKTVLEYPEDIRRIDNFGITPFGSRRYLVVPTERSVIPLNAERRFRSVQARHGNCLLLEIDTPFDTVDRSTEVFLSGFYRQIGSALLLRDRESMAYVDTMTGSVIGCSWTRRLKELLAENVSESAPLSVLFADVDRLREINELFGFRVGDGVLKAIVSSISQTLRPNDMIGRIKEDLFGIILPDTGSENAFMIAERIRREIAGKDIRPDQVPVTVSIGSATVHSSGDSLDMIVNEAYEALQGSRVKGSNQTTTWSMNNDVGDTDVGILATFNTGDPGWDYTLNQAALELLTIDNPSIELIARKLRNAFRSEYLYLKSASGNRFEVGIRFAGKIVEEIQSNRIGRIEHHPDILGEYHVLSMQFEHGGRLISAWDNTIGVSQSVKNIFKAFAELSEMLLER
ncbi:MAG: GGDEF domain-containing protein, partial [Candidatus Aegiribacteria sp.]|nr:GGDEF domain-containing protein [Candidatus Aegiribacteria sp.]